MKNFRVVFLSLISAEVIILLIYITFPLRKIAGACVINWMLCSRAYSLQKTVLQKSLTKLTEYLNQHFKLAHINIWCTTVLILKRALLSFNIFPLQHTVPMKKKRLSWINNYIFIHLLNTYNKHPLLMAFCYYSNTDNSILL